MWSTVVYIVAALFLAIGIPVRCIAKMKSNILILVTLLSATLCSAQQRCNCQIVEKKLYFHDTLCITGNDTFDYPDTPLFYDRILLENDTAYRFIAQMQTLTYMAMDEKNLRFNNAGDCMRVILLNEGESLKYSIYSIGAMSDTLLMKEGELVDQPREINEARDYAYTVCSIVLPRKMKKKIWSLTNTIVHAPKESCMPLFITYYVELSADNEYYSLATDNCLYCYEVKETRQQEKWRYKHQNKYLIQLKKTLLKIRSKCEKN